MRLSNVAIVGTVFLKIFLEMSFLGISQTVLPYCNSMCPDRFVVGELTSNNWPVWAKITIASAIIGIALLCLLGKMLFALWMYWLDKKQDESLDQQLRHLPYRCGEGGREGVGREEGGNYIMLMVC